MGAADRFHGGVYRLAIRQKRDERVGVLSFTDHLLGGAENDVAAHGLG